MLKHTVFVLILLSLSLQAGNLEEIKNFLHGLGQETVLTPEPRRCGFSIMTDIKMHYNQLDADSKMMADKLLSVNLTNYQDSIISPAGHFILYYDTTGNDAVDSKDSLANGIPDFIDSAAAVFDHVWQVEIERLGFKRPVDAEGRPVEHYPVYFQALSNMYGYTYPDQPYYPEEGIVQYSSYIVIDNDFKGYYYTNGLDALKVTAAHEFNHAIQLSYHVRFNGSYEDIFLMEMTSTWMEDYVYNEVNDYYQYLNYYGGIFSDFYNFRFNSTGGYDYYANCLFLHMINKKYNPHTIVEFWETIPAAPAIEAMDIVLTNKGSSFAEEQNHYAAWLYFTADRAVAGQYFPEGAAYPQFDLQELPDSPVNIASYGMKVYKIPINEGGFYESRLTADNDDGCYNHIVGIRLAGRTKSFKDRQIFSKSENENLFVTLSNPATFPLADVQYSVKTADVFVKGNPVSTSQNGNQVIFEAVPEYAVITIYDILGRKVETLKPNGTETQVRWNLTNINGRKLASSVYFYIVRSHNITSKGKFVLIR
ncbi:MAG: T9SS type A sorting domain-containing protein [Calditrichaceae bacterium]|nr:T9SS type A sorting domain-containing protein [Calditrichaceae bacterium]MBN2707513.1 T9SS type A sorting domain-containing protein [Calditrichaceae bacterium]RQV95602.1 MAG: T9SS C-terminal target domain-containing protein [Calditrichota bacterium]